MDRKELEDIYKATEKVQAELDHDTYLAWADSIKGFQSLLHRMMQKTM